MKITASTIGYTFLAAICGIFLWLWGPFILYCLTHPNGPGQLPFG